MNYITTLPPLIAESKDTLEVGLNSTGFYAQMLRGYAGSPIASASGKTKSEAISNLEKKLQQMEREG